MRITVIGDGKVGHTLAENLALEGHDVVIVDRSDEVLQKSIDTLDVMCVQGNGANIHTLMEADVAHSDIIIAATTNDETNMLCCMVAKKLGAKFAIARIRDPEYDESFSLLQNELGIDMSINPERATALEISRLLRFPFAASIESFARGKVEMVAFRAREKDEMVGCPLKDLPRYAPQLPKVLYCGVEREGVAYIPTGDFVIRPGDSVYVASDRITITAYFQRMGKHTARARSVLILGGGRISYYLAKIVMPMGIHVTIIEIDEAKARNLSEMLPEAEIVWGDGTDQELLEQEGLEDVDAFVALSNRDEENLITGLYAAHKQVDKVIVKNNRINYVEVVNSLGLESIVSPKEITSNSILRYVRAHAIGVGTAVEKVHRIMDGQAEALEFIIGENAPFTGIQLKDMTIRRDTLAAVIVRGGKVIIPFGHDHLEPLDTVIMITKEKGIRDLSELLTPIS